MYTKINNFRDGDETRYYNPKIFFLRWNYKYKIQIIFCTQSAMKFKSGLCHSTSTELRRSVAIKL